MKLPDGRSCDSKSGSWSLLKALEMKTLWSLGSNKSLIRHRPSRDFPSFLVYGKISHIKLTKSLTLFFPIIRSILHNEGLLYIYTSTTLIYLYFHFILLLSSVTKNHRRTFRKKKKVFSLPFFKTFPQCSTLFLSIGPSLERRATMRSERSKGSDFKKI